MRRAHEFEHDVHRRDLHDLLEGDDHVGTEVDQDRVMRGRAGDGGDVGAQQPSDLHRGGTDATAGARDEQSLALLEATLQDERVVGGDEGLGETAGLIEGDGVGNVDQVCRGHQGTRRLGAAADDGAHPSSHECRVDARADLEDTSREFHARDVGGPARGRGVEAAALQEIGGVDAREVRGDQYLALGGNGVGTLLEK